MSTSESLTKNEFLEQRFTNRKLFRDPILRITDTIDGSFLACSQDGLVSFWSPNMELKRTRSVQVRDVTSGCLVWNVLDCVKLLLFECRRQNSLEWKFKRRSGSQISQSCINTTNSSSELGESPSHSLNYYTPSDDVIHSTVSERSSSSSCLLSTVTAWSTVLRQSPCVLIIGEFIQSMLLEWRYNYAVF